VVACIAVSVTRTSIACFAADAPDLPPALDSTVITDPITGANPEERDRKAMDAFQKELGDLPNTDPKTAAAKYTQYLTDHPGISPMIGMHAAAELGRIYHAGVKDDTQALAIYDWGLKKWPNFQGIVFLVNERAKLLLSMGKSDEAEATYKDGLTQILHGWPQDANDPLDQYSKMLQAEGKSAEMISVLGKFLVMQPFYLDPGPANWDWVYPRIIDTLIQEKKPEEAIRWAKLRFVMAAYDAGAIDRASRLLAKTWSSTEAGKADLDAFGKAEEDASVHNPLADVTLPDLDPAALKEKLAARGQDADGISMLILSGSLKEAMSQAREMQNNKATAKQGILQVCRVFKAADLNLRRAGAYLTYLRSSQGEDPVVAFLKN
jgi:tetratricopeptide (TPR) repeat protein